MCTFSNDYSQMWWPLKILYVLIILAVVAWSQINEELHANLPTVRR